MGEDIRFDSIDTYILCMLHQLVFGDLGLMGDAKERLLREWYLQHKEMIHEKIKEIITTEEMNKAGMDGK